MQITTSTIKPTLGNSFLCFVFPPGHYKPTTHNKQTSKTKTGTSSLLPRDETRGEKHPAQSQQTKMTLLLLKKTTSRKTSELGEAIIVTTDRKTDIPSHVALTKTGRCINCQQQQSFPPHRTTKSIYIGNWPKWAIYEFCL